MYDSDYPETPSTEDMNADNKTDKKANNKTDKELRPLSDAELSAFFGQTGMLVKAGITPIGALEIMVQDNTDKESANIIRAIGKQLVLGNSLSDALGSTGVFPEYAVKMTAVGEQSGELDKLLPALAEHYDRRDSLRENIRSAVSYPVIMILILFVIVILLLTKVLPVFARVFASLGTSMSGIAGALMSGGSLLTVLSVVLIALCTAAVLLFLWFYGTAKGQKQWNRFAASFPLTRKYVEDIAAGQFAESMAMTLNSGISVPECIELSASTVANANVLSRIEVLKKELISGETLPDAIAKAGVFTNLYCRMIKAGFAAGSIDAVFLEISDRYRDASEKKLTRILSVLEPTLVILLAVIVGMILLSVIIPLMGVMAEIG